MKILVTGATGFIGRHIVQALLARGHVVVASSRSPENARQMPWSTDVEYRSFDLSESQEVQLCEYFGHPEVVIHTAWPDLLSYRDPVHFERHAGDHYRFLRRLVTGGVNRCMVLGTCLEYGMQSGELHEDLPAKPTLAYPLGKHVLRLMLEGLQRTTPFTLQWLRLFYLHGKGQRSSSLLAQLDKAIMDGAKVFDMSPGDQLRDYIEVTQAAELVSELVGVPDFDGVVNCCSGAPITVRQLVEDRIASRGATLHLNTGAYPYPDYEPRHFWGSRRRLDSLLAAARHRSAQRRRR